VIFWLVGKLLLLAFALIGILLWWEKRESEIGRRDRASQHNHNVAELTRLQLQRERDRR
jgi:uncharacterized iron-regulated membrane protein